MSKRQKVGTTHTHKHVPTFFDKLPKDVVGLLKDCVDDNSHFGLWAYWV